MSTRLSGSLLALFVLVAGGMFAWAQASAPRAMPYQGRLEMGGQPVTGTHTLDFQFHDAPTDGNTLGGGISRTVNVVRGAFATVLSPVPDAIFDGEEVWLSITVDGDALAGRQQLLSVPFAMGSVATEETTLSGGLRIGTGADVGEVGVGQLAPSATVRFPLGDEATGGLHLYDAQNSSEEGFIG